jgi:hypothetical protein
VPSSRGIIACCNEFGRRQNDQRMFVLICEVLTTLRSKVTAQWRRAFGNADFSSIEGRWRANEKRGSILFAAFFLVESGAEVTHD